LLTFAEQPLNAATLAIVSGRSLPFTVHIRAQHI